MTGRTALPDCAGNAESGGSLEGAALVAREVGEGKSGKNDAAEREHSARRLDQVGVGVELRFLGQPVEPLSRLCERGHGEFTARSHLVQPMHPGMRRNAAARR